MDSLETLSKTPHHFIMLKRYYSFCWDDLDEDLQQSIQTFTKNQADAWQIQWEALNALESQTAFASQPGAAVDFQAGKFVSREDNQPASVRHASDTWDQYDEHLKKSLGKRASTQAAFRHCLWDVMASDEPDECCFFDCCCEGSGYRIAEKKAA